MASLTPVERDVVRLVAEGHTNAESVNACSSRSTRSRSICPTSTPRWMSTDGRISPHRSPAVTCSTRLAAETYPVG